MFVSSVWVFMGLCAYKIALHVLYANQVIGSYAAGYDYRVLVAPFFLFGLELFLWLKMFRYAVHPARMFAGVVGAYIMLMVVFVNVVVADMTGNDVSGVHLLLYAYAGMGHLVYALLGAERGY